MLPAWPQDRGRGRKQAARIERAAAGHAGALLHGYRRAADLEAWTLSLATVSPPAYRLQAALGPSSAYWLAQRPLALALEAGAATWTWQAVEVDLASRPGYVLATVTGRPEVVRRPAG